MLTSKQRAALRKAANTLTPVFQIGKEGVDEAQAKAVSDCLAKRELLKLRILETAPVSPREAAEELKVSARCEVVQVIGGVIVLFRKKPKESAFDEVL